MQRKQTKKRFKTGIGILATILLLQNSNVLANTITEYSIDRIRSMFNQRMVL